MPGLMYPPNGPTVSGQNLTVDWALKSPTFIQRAIDMRIQGRFISDYIFRAGTAGSGSVVYERTLGIDEKYPTRGDVEIIEPGDEFPLVDVGEVTRQTAIVEKYGAAALITYEQVRRNQRDKVQEAIIKIGNAVVRKTDARAMAALNADAAVLTMAAGAAWSAGTTDPFADLVKAKGMVDATELGYNADTVIINPSDAANLLLNKDIRDQLPRENVNVNPLLTGRFVNLAGIPNWIQTPLKAAGSIFLLQQNVAGVNADELAFYSRRIDEEANERWRVMGARVSVPIITDPKSVLKLTGI